MSYKSDFREGVSIWYWMLAFVVVASIGTCATGFFTNTQQVIYNEFKPEAMLKKYEWFKDAHASLQKKKADIEIYTTRVNQLEESYGDTPRKEWDRTDKETLNIWNMELAGVKSSYNALAAEYNSQSSKFNWSSFEGDVPQEIITME